jgi:hypothetical protein
MADGRASVVPSALARLAAAGPYEPDAAELALYGRLIGQWDVDWFAFDADGVVAEQRRAEWHFAWILGGRGVQDVIWIAGAPPEGDGTTLRCWDRERGHWRVVFMSPGDGEFVTLTGRRDGEGIVQDVADRSPPERWTFSEIMETSFVWRAERKERGAWRVTHEMRATRRG